MTRPSIRLAAVALAALLVLGTGVAANAATTPRPTAVGDLTGDGVADRVHLGQDGSRCVASIAPGLGKGRFGTPFTVVLSKPDPFCPDHAVVLTAPTPTENRLAVLSGLDGSRIAVYAVAGQRASYLGGPKASVLAVAVFAARDFDGDGYDDLWAIGDDGTFQAWTGRDGAWRLLSNAARMTAVEEQFFDLNHNAGTDLLLGTTGSIPTVEQAIVVDGRTGATTVLWTSDDRNGEPTPLTVRVLDIDHDAYPDLELSAVRDGTPVTRYFLNRSFRGGWSFQPCDRYGNPVPSAT